MLRRFFSFIFCLIFLLGFSFSQNVAINNYSVNSVGQVQLSIQAQADKYYVLNAQHSPTFNWVTSITMGVNGTMVISEPAGAYPETSYAIIAHDISNPGDIDGDGVDDVTEFNNMPTDAPINFADPISFIDGATSIPDAQTFMDLATVNNVSWAPFLDGQLYVKFGILDRDGPQPKIYFINSNTYAIHANFFSGIGATVIGDDGSGEIVFNPNDILPNGVIGSYSFNFSFGDAKSFEDTQRTFELLAANMPFLQNNMNHFIGQADEILHNNQYASDFVGSRIDVVLESDVFAEINYIPFHEAEGYGFFKHMNLNETPGSRDIVLYDALPNSLPRVGGIITSVIQTPLSHVNLRAIQDNVPNAYIKDPLSIDSINNLLGNYVYYKVENDHFQIRQATLSEVNNWYEELRPTEPQIPIRDLSMTQILPLDTIEFEMSSSFGAKCANVATMRSFGFPNGTIPNGFGIPFYFYDEFMKFNNFYLEAQVMINNPVFNSDINFRTQRLKDFRKAIKAAPMPQWMMNQLQTMHDAFPSGTAVRCRSSTNNEDLPGFSGAGLYTSKTQHLDEGHISKSVKQIYASMWNFRAYEERDFYRVDHFIAAMGILCHPNFQAEQSNGVGVSIDPIYKTDSTYYLNTQVGESLITNPDPNSVPEEILLYQDSTQSGGYQVLRLSNLVNPGELVMDQIYLNQMRDYLKVIHDEFALLYDVVGAKGFGMDIEYKVTAQDQLVIKQARPWVSFWADIKANNDLDFTEIINPSTSSTLSNNELVTAKISNKGLNNMNDFEVTLMVDGQLVETITVMDTIKPFENADIQFTTPQNFSIVGDYEINGIVYDVDDEYANNDTLKFVLSKLHLIDAEITIDQLTVLCDNNIEAKVILKNHGESTITAADIEVIVNGVVVDILNFPTNILFQDQEVVSIIIDNNLQQVNNNITVNILNINNLNDLNSTNNSYSATTNLDSDYDVVTLFIDADNYPSETSWEIVEKGSNETIASGALQPNTQTFTEDICLDYASCYTLHVYDSYGDGICCDYGFGFFQLKSSDGTLILYNNGEFDYEAEEVFCPDGTGCGFTANINVANATANDGIISINTISGVSPFQYSIDGGQTFIDSNLFINLAPGDYDIVIQGATGFCTYQESVTVEHCTFTSTDIKTSGVSSMVSANGSIVITPTSGISPYLYSIDGGNNFVGSNTFSNLAFGTYNVTVKDASDICMYEIGVPIEVRTDTSNSNNISFNGINIYPNPSENYFSVEVETPSDIKTIFMYNITGQLVKTINSLTKDIDISDLKKGTYLISISFFNGRQEYFKLVKK